MSEITQIRRLLRHLDLGHPDRLVSPAQALGELVPALRDHCPPPSHRSSPRRAGADQMRTDELIRLAEEYGISGPMDFPSIRDRLSARLDELGARLALRHYASGWMDSVFELLVGEKPIVAQKTLYAVESFALLKGGHEIRHFQESERTRTECVDQIFLLLDQMRTEDVRDALEAARQFLERHDATDD